MIRLGKFAALLIAFGFVGLTGCAPKMTRETLREMKPQRAAELDQLNVFVGTWSGTSECTMAGLDDTLKGNGTTTYRWDLDNNVLVENGAYEIEEMGTMRGMGVMTYDAKRKKFHSSWNDSWGGHGEGWLKRSADGKCWTVKSKSSSSMGDTTGKGTMTFIDNNTVEWSWKEYCMGGMMKCFEMKGTMTRQ